MNTATVVWGSIEEQVRKDDMMPVWARYYDGQGILARILTFHDYRIMDERLVPARMVVHPEDKPGESTTLCKMRPKHIAESRQAGCTGRWCCLGRITLKTDTLAYRARHHEVAFLRAPDTPCSTIGKLPTPYTVMDRGRRAKKCRMSGAD